MIGAFVPPAWAASASGHLKSPDCHARISGHSRTYIVGLRSIIVLWISLYISKRLSASSSAKEASIAASIAGSKSHPYCWNVPVVEEW